MKNRIITILCILALLSTALSSCVKELDGEVVNNLPESVVYNDKTLIQSTLAAFYTSVNYGQQNGDYGAYHLLDEANVQYGAATTTDDEKQIPRNFYRVYDYGLVRRINQFLKGINSSTAKSLPSLPEPERLFSVPRPVVFTICCSVNPYVSPTRLNVSLKSTLLFVIHYITSCIEKYHCMIFF